MLPSSPPKMIDLILPLARIPQTVAPPCTSSAPDATALSWSVLDLAASLAANASCAAAVLGRPPMGCSLVGSIIEGFFAPTLVMCSRSWHSDSECSF